jgi:hypothetical protein
VLTSSRSFAAKGSVAALLVGGAVLGVAALIAWRRPRIAGITLAGALTLVLLVGLAPQVERARAESAAGATAFAELGEQLAHVTDPRAVIAVLGAGSSQYVSERPMIDLLGKSDRHVAHEPSPVPWFLPGHNKWDVDYSIGELRPDVVAQGPATDGQLRGWGYVPMRLKGGTFTDAIDHEGGPVIYVQPHSRHVHFDRLVATD